MRKHFVFVLLLALTPIYAAPTMTVHFIDVGQADACLLEFPCGAILIDAGTQEDQEHALTSYLSTFFESRPHLENTLDTIIITHNHIDHTRALREVVELFTVNHLVESGHDRGTGTGDPNYIRRHRPTGIDVDQIEDWEVRGVSTRIGYSNTLIDPIDCGEIDPVIRILSGRKTRNPNWSHEAYDNKNNHSLVIRVDFGEGSILFTGDLEEEGIESLVAYYDGTDMLDVDVYQVGHHGSHNATTKELVSAMTPEVSVISAGKESFGRNSSSRYTTFRYGHPRRSVVRMLARATQRRREALRVRVGIGSQEFRGLELKKAVYATSWDGTVLVALDVNGGLAIETNAEVGERDPGDGLVYASRRSRVFHVNADCVFGRRIKARNRVTGDEAREGRRVHEGCGG